MGDSPYKLDRDNGLTYRCIMSPTVGISKVPEAGAMEHPSDLSGGRPGMVAFYSLAFFSGAAALIYEITWSKMLALTFGSTTHSVAAVVAGFMGGMGLGAWLYHFLYNRVGRPMILYACLEFGIGLTALVLTQTFYSLPSLFAQVSAVVPDVYWLGWVRFGAVFCLLLVPAALMGATFPALCTVVIRTSRGVDRHLGMIYGINTLGAAAGALVAGLFLNERFGLRASAGVASGINVIVGLAALGLLSARWGRREAQNTPPAKSNAISTGLPRSLTGLVLFVSGFATLSFEILWFRSLHYFVGNGTYAVTEILVIFLVGLGLGSLLLRRAAERPAPERDLAMCQLAIAVLALGAMALQWLLLSQPALRDSVSIFSVAVRVRPWWTRLMANAVAAVVTMLPATLFMGLSFPLASRLFLGDVNKLGTRIGWAYFLANLGSILGAVLGAVLLLPLFGTIGGTKVAAGLNLLLGLLLVLAIRRRVTGCVLPSAGAIILVGVMAWMLPNAQPFLGETRAGAQKGRLVFTEEGDLATVQVTEDLHRPAKKTMSIDGTMIGWSAAYRGEPVFQKEVVLAHLPMVLDTRVRRTLNIGLGSAVTLGTLASYDTVRTLDCVEINAAVVRACRLFDESRVLSEPRVHLVVDDAVHYLLRSSERYDLIISDGKQDPFFAGNATMLCREFYRYALARLGDEGLFVQWVTLGMLHDDFRVNLRTLCEVFPQVEVFYLPRLAVIMVASRSPISGRPRLSGEQYQTGRAYPDLAPYGIDNPTALLAHWVAGKAAFVKALGNGPISTWDHLLLDFTAYKASVAKRVRAKRENLSLLLAAEAVARNGAEGPFGLQNTPYGRSARLVRRGVAACFGDDWVEMRKLMEEARSVNPDDRTSEVVSRQLLMEARRASKPAG